MVCVFKALNFRFLRNLFIFFFIFISLKIQANNLGSDVQTFHPTSDQLDLISVQSGHTLKTGWWSASVFGMFSQNNLLIYSLPIEDQIRQKSVDTLIGAQVDLAFGVMPHLEWGISLPANLKQTMSDDAYRKLYVQHGVSSWRNHIKYSLAEENSDEGAAFIFTFDLPNVDQSPYLGKVARPVYIFEVAYDIKTQSSLLAFNGGYKLRQPSDAVANATMWPLGNELLYSLGYSHRFYERSALSYVLELNGSYPVSSTPYRNSNDISTLETVIGFKGLLKSFSSWNAGIGFKLLPSLSPDYRLFVGYSWSWNSNRGPEHDILLEERNLSDPRPRVSSQWYEQMKQIGGDDSDIDGVIDERDECPSTLKGLPVDSYGCPFDKDNDGVYDYEDACAGTSAKDIVDRRGCPVRY